MSAPVHNGLYEHGLCAPPIAEETKTKQKKEDLGIVCLACIPNSEGRSSPSLIIGRLQGSPGGSSACNATNPGLGSLLVARIGSLFFGVDAVASPMGRFRWRTLARSMSWDGSFAAHSRRAISSPCPEHNHDQWGHVFDLLDRICARRVSALRCAYVCACWLSYVYVRMCGHRRLSVRPGVC